MSDKPRALVAYATRYGTTAQIAGWVGEALRSQGIDATVAEVSTVQSIDDYDAVIIGSPIYFSRALRAAADFVKKFAPGLQDKRTAMFSVGVTVNQKAGREFTDQALRTLAGNAPGVTPTYVMFKGRVDLSRMNLAYRWFLKLFQGFGDIDQTQRGDVEAWAKEFADSLG